MSEEDLDLRNLTWDELMVTWNAWLAQAQISNDLDEHTYAHGVFVTEPGWKLDASGAVVREGAVERVPSVCASFDDAASVDLDPWMKLSGEERLRIGENLRREAYGEDLEEIERRERPGKA